jgi:dihydroxyacetone kinase-like protein
MNKGFMLVKKQLDGNESIGMSEALKILGRILVEEIGGSMGPLYGMFFRRMARASKHDEINTHVLKDMLSSAFHLDSRNIYMIQAYNMFKYRYLD